MFVGLISGKENTDFENILFNIEIACVTELDLKNIHAITVEIKVTIIDINSPKLGK